MELTLADVARRYGRTPRAVQLAVAGGQLAALRQLGRTLLVDDLAVQAWIRSSARGRCWSPRIRDAALDLLSMGATADVAGSDKSRLAHRLRTMSAREIAHACGGLGTWARYDASPGAEVEAIGPSATEMEDLGIVGGGGWLFFGRVDSLDVFEREADARLSASGNLGLVERAADDRRARQLLDTYLLGDARVSAAAGARLEELARAL